MVCSDWPIVFNRPSILNKYRSVYISRDVNIVENENNTNYGDIMLKTK